MTDKDKVIKKTKEEMLELQRKIITQTRDLTVTAFGLVAALAWNAAIQKLFEVIFPNKTGSLIAMFIYAIFITLIIVSVTYYLSKIADGLNSKIEKLSPNNDSKNKDEEKPRT